ncbi:MAG: hypothetical protein HY262_01215 [Chloroflexi bacterium]|nr:hypothetical protein [Chloroflexota bacterium]
MAPVTHIRVPATAAQPLRRATVAFGVGLGALLVVAAISAGEWYSILLWLPVGLVVGSIARGVRLVWIAWLAVAAYYPIAAALGVQDDTGPFWYLGAILGGAILSAGFAAGTAIGWRTDPWTRSRDGCGDSGDRPGARSSVPSPSASSRLADTWRTPAASGRR